MENKANGGRAEFSPPADIPRRRPTETRRGAILLCGGVCLTAAAAALFYPWVRLLMSILCPFCPLHELTGLNCPLCGGTRCVGALARLDLGEAIYYNPLVVAGLAVGAYFLARLFASCFTSPYREYRPKLPAWTLYALIAVLVLFLVVRNLPFYRAVLY